MTTGTAHRPETGRHPTDHSERPARVLIIEEEALVRTMLARYLPRIGYDAVALRSTRDACALLQTEEWDAVMMSAPPALGTSGKRFLVFRESAGFGEQAAAPPIPQVLTAPFRLEEVGEALHRLGVLSRAAGIGTR